MTTLFRGCHMASKFRKCYMIKSSKMVKMALPKITDTKELQMKASIRWSLGMVL